MKLFTVFRLTRKHVAFIKANKKERSEWWLYETILTKHDSICRGCQLKLTTKQRNKLPDSAFAIPEKRAYPVEDKAHARNALARVRRFGTPKEKAEVCKVVSQRFPEIHETHCSLHRLKA